MYDRIIPSELFAIWKTQPTEPGDTLSGGENVANLVRLGLIEKTAAGYICTPKGAAVIQRLIEYLDKMEVVLSVHVQVFDRSVNTAKYPE